MTRAIFQFDVLPPLISGEKSDFKNHLKGFLKKKKNELRVNLV